MTNYRKGIRVVLILFFLFQIAPLWAQIGLGNYGQGNSLDEVSYLDPKEYEVAGITVMGAETLNETALISLSGLKVGDRIKVPGSAISSAIKKLWKQGIIGDISIFANKVEGDKIYLTIKLKERPRLSRFNLQGVNSTQANEITEDLELIRGKIVTDALLNNVETTAKKYFVEKGFLNTEVNIAQEEDSVLTNAVKLNIDIDKKQKVKIQQIHIAGNDKITDGKLKSKMKNTNEKLRFSLFRDLFYRLTHFNFSKTAKFFAEKDTTGDRGFLPYINKHVNINVFNSSKFIKDDFQDDKQALIDFYNSKGYRDADVLSDSVALNNNNTLDLYLKVKEGNQYRFGDISWTGNYIYEEQQLEQVLGIQPGDIYDRELLDQKLNFNPSGPDVSSLYMDNGYLFFNIQPVEVRIEDDSIDVEMRIFEGEQATVDEIIISGNDRTSDHVIRREIRTLPGQKFNRSLLIRTQRELSQLGYFDPEQIGINPVPNPADGTVDIEYSLVEKPSDQIELSGGWGGAFGFVGTVGLVFNNFSVKNIPHFDRWRPLPVGDGQRLSLRIQANGRQFQNYSMTFSEPWLGGKKPNNFSVSLSRTVQRRFQFFTRGEEVGRIIINSASVGLGRRLRWPDDYFTLSNFLAYKLYDVQGQTQFAGITNTRANSITFETTLSRNSIDSPMFPRSGSQVSLNAAFTPPYSAFRQIDYSPANQDRYKFIEYHKWMFDAKFYTQLAEKLVLSTNIHYGFIGSYGDGPINTPFERFALGGAGLAGQQGGFAIATDIIGLRGYDDNTIIPRSVETGFDNEGNIISNSIEGGVAYNKYIMELRYLVSPNPSATIFVLGFVEAGNNVDSFKDYNPFDLYRSAGVGARIFMPAFGLLGIDWGYGFDPSLQQLQSGDTSPSGPQFHFRIGQQIR